MLLRIGSKGAEVRELQTRLVAAGFPCDIDGAYGPGTAAAVEDFQDSADLLEDGVAGKDTQAALAKKLGLAAPAPEAPRVIAAPSERMRSVRCLANVMGTNSLFALNLREDAAKDWLAAQLEVTALGGGITTAGGFRALSAGGGKAQSATSLHYVGIAHDLAMGSGMQSVHNPYIVVYGAKPREWRVFMRCAGGTEMALDAVLCSTVKGRTYLRTEKVTGKFIDFTALMAKHGFHPIRGRKSFFQGKSYSGAEWWHFQYERALTPGVSTFGGELLKVYRESEIRAKFRGDWDAVKGYVWQEDWF